MLAKKRACELAPIYREAIVLREIEAMSYRQIAELTDVPIGTVMLGSCALALSRARPSHA